MEGEPGSALSKKLLVGNRVEEGFCLFDSRTSASLLTRTSNERPDRSGREESV